MDYKRIYNELVKRAKDRSEPEIAEKHHIVPKHMGGSDRKNNLVKLTPREHVLAHMLLWKIYPDDGKTIATAVLMGFGRTESKTNSKVLGALREASTKWQRENPPLSMLGKTHTEKTKAKMSESRKKMIAKSGHPAKGYKYGDEYKERLSKALKGRTSPMKGVIRSDESNKRTSEAMKEWHAKRRAAGIKASGGRPKKVGK